MKQNLLIVLFLLPYLLISQQKDVKVGLVLSGGGAKGAAHVSVLKAIERAGVRVDYIGGTSFGAIVGSMYASGYNASEIDSIIKATDFREVLSNAIPRKNRPFKEKELGKQYVVSLPIINFQIGLPPAFTYGQGVQNLLTQLTKDVNHITDFSKLPIPFICVATNLETGKQEVLKKGFLPEAVRASGAFPSLIAPVKIDGKLLVDGGIVNNFPVEEVRKMGADVIIGVDIQDDLKCQEDLNSAIKIINQIIGFQIYKGISKKRENVDILISPNVQEYGVIDFDKIDIIMKEGNIAVERHYNELLALAKRQKPTPPIAKPLPVDYIHIKEIQVKGNQKYSDAYIKGKLELKKNENITYSRLSESISKLFSTKNFKNIQYQIQKLNDGSKVVLNIEEAPTNPYLNIAVNYNDLYKTGVLLGISKKRNLFKNDLFSADVVLGDNIRYDIDYFVDNGMHWSFGVHSQYNKLSKNAAFSSEFLQRINVTYHEFVNQLYAQTMFNRKIALKAGIEHTFINLYTNNISSVSLGESNEVKSGDKNYRLIIEKSAYIKGISQLLLDTYDDKNFPKKGILFNAKADWFLYGSDKKNFTPFVQLSGKMGFAAPVFPRLTINVSIDGGMTIGNNSKNILNFKLGGYGDFNIANMISFYGFDVFDDQINTRIFAKTTASFRYEIFKKNYLLFSTNSGLTDELTYKNYQENLKIGYLVGYEIDSFMGPLRINYAFSPDKSKNYWHLSLGYWF